MKASPKTRAAQRRKARLTRRDGEHNPNAKLNAAAVRAIRAMAAKGMPRADLAEFYGIAVSSVHLIIHRKRWEHVA